MHGTSWHTCTGRLAGTSSRACTQRCTPTQGHSWIQLHTQTHIHVRTDTHTHLPTPTLIPAPMSTPKHPPTQPPHTNTPSPPVFQCVLRNNRSLGKACSYSAVSLCRASSMGCSSPCCPESFATKCLALLGKIPTQFDPHPLPPHSSCWGPKTEPSRKRTEVLEFKFDNQEPRTFKSGIQDTHSIVQHTKD